MEHPIHNLMKISMENIKDMIDVDTIVGDPMPAGNDTTIIPISRVRFGFAAGGTEQKSKDKGDNAHTPFGGGSGGTVSINPIAFLVIKSDDISVLSLENQTHLYEKLIDLVPKAVEKVKGSVPKKMKNDAEKKLSKDIDLEKAKKEL